MSQNLPAVPTFVQNLALAIPQEYAAALAQAFGAADEDFGGAFRNISLKGNRFNFKEGGNVTIHPKTTLECVILHMGYGQHHDWYSKGYNPNADNVQPDAVWYAKSGFPNEVPAHIREKKPDGSYHYNFRQRLVVAAIVTNAQTGQPYLDLERPWVLDIGAKSLFGEAQPALSAFSLSGLVRFCKSNRLAPCQFVTQLIFDARESVPSLQFRPFMQDGVVQLLGPDWLPGVYHAMSLPEVQDMARIKERGTWTGNVTTPTEAAASYVATTTPAPVQGVAPAQTQPVQATVLTQQPAQMVSPAAPTAPVAPQAPIAPVAPPTTVPSTGTPLPTATPGVDPGLLAAAQAASAAANATLVAPAAPAPQAGVTAASVGGAMADLLAAAGAY